MTTKKEYEVSWSLNCYDVMFLENKSKFIYPVKESVRITSRTMSYFAYFMKLIRILDPEVVIDSLKKFNKI